MARNAQRRSQHAPRARRDAQRTAVEVISGSVEETQAFGERIGRLLRAGDVVALQGELGSGKTTLIQGMARGLGREPGTVKSPTFVLMREYPPGPPTARAGAGGEVPLVHVDGYRLEGPPAASWLDADLVFSPQKITLIEWAERFAGLLPDHHLTVRLSHVSTNRRRLQLVPIGERATELVTRLQASKTRTPQPEASAAEEPHDAPGH